MVKKSKNKALDENDLDKWFQNADLSRLYDVSDFVPHSFKKLEETLIEQSYQKSQETIPVTLRLPKNLVQKLKLIAMQNGVAYQTLVKLLLNEKTNQFLSHPHP